MASKLKRTPLFGYDGNLGIPIIPPSTKPKSSSSYEYQNSTKSTMEVGVSAHRSPYATMDNGSSSNGVPPPPPPSRLSSTEAPNATPNKHVNFGTNGPVVEEKKREKFLTAKYGTHQMALIRKRLRVEMWMYDKLQELHGTDEVEIDLDAVLDIDDDGERRQYIISLLHNAQTSRDIVNIFVGDLLEKVKTL